MSIHRPPLGLCCKTSLSLRPAAFGWGRHPHRVRSSVLFVEMNGARRESVQVPCNAEPFPVPTGGVPGTPGTGGRHAYRYASEGSSHQRAGCLGARQEANLVHIGGSKPGSRHPSQLRRSALAITCRSAWVRTVLIMPSHTQCFRASWITSQMQFVVCLKMFSGTFLQR